MNIFHLMRSVYARYRARHGRYVAPRTSLLNSSGVQIGCVDVAMRDTAGFKIVGWVDAASVAVETARKRYTVETHIRRSDVTALFPHLIAPGFELYLNEDHAEFSEELDLRVCYAGQGDPVTLTLRLDKKALNTGFAKAALRALPAGIRWLLVRSETAKAEIKRKLELDCQLETNRVQASLFKGAGKSLCSPGTGITLILPVYNGREFLAGLLGQIFSNTDLSFHLFVVEDCSSDPCIRPYLRDWLAALPKQQAQSVTLLENDKNLGFVGSVNRALQSAKDRHEHVVLLNTDIILPPNWASRLIYPLLQHHNIASVTPMSNDAEIFSVPRNCEPSPVTAQIVTKVDKVAQSFCPDASISDAPTGVGFCMALHRDWLRKVPVFDEVFGRGYGEEVDWCQKVYARGGRNVVTTNLFVGHFGGQSFGTAEKRRRISENHKIIQTRYPHYEGRVQSFIQRDPVATARMTLGVAYLGSSRDKPLPVYLAHSLGGGAEIYLQQRIAKEGAAVVVRVGGRRQWQCELYENGLLAALETNSFSDVEHILSGAKRRNVVYNCGVGATRAECLPHWIGQLSDGINSTLEVLFHDYLPISPSYTLLDREGRYNPTEFDGSIRTQDARTPWQDRWGALLSRAQEIVVFSEAAKEIVSSVWPEYRFKFVLCPHELPWPVAPVHLIPKPVRTVAVLGNIGQQKGASLLSPLARLLADHGINLIVIGNVDPQVSLDERIVVHGDYSVERLPQLVELYGITDWLIPSIWPETFSFTTHEALATGMPVFAFDIGAQGDAVAEARNGTAVKFGSLHALPECLVDAILNTANKGQGQTLSDVQQSQSLSADGQEDRAA